MTNLGREELNEYLEKPLVIETGGISTQVDVSATSLSTGGLSGSFIIKNQGNISILDNRGNLSIIIGF
jgi:hypothetical protein